MRIKAIIFGFILFFILSSVAVSESSYGKIDTYYNGELLPGAEISKPVLKIGEPFIIGIDLTVYQNSFVNVQLTELGQNDFTIISGPTTNMDDYTGLITIEKNTTQTYEWTLVATDNWAGGSMPINLHYEILDPSSPEPIVSSEFTIAVPYISNEYYEGEPPSESLPLTNEPESAPAFNALASLLALCLAATRR